MMAELNAGKTVISNLRSDRMLVAHLQTRTTLSEELYPISVITSRQMRTHTTRMPGMFRRLRTTIPHGMYTQERPTST